MENVLVAKNISKQYKRKKEVVNAITNCSFEILEGTSTGFVGLNGAGKSTTIKILTGIMKPTEGEVCLMGKNPFIDRKKIMNDIGVLFGQRSNLIYDLPVKESFKLLKDIYNIPVEKYNNQLDYLAQYIDFKSLWEVPVRKMSLGQRMRCEVASVLLHNPKMVFFDEAFIGIDYSSKNMIRQMIDSSMKERKTSYFITSHDLKDIEKMCNDIIIINHGEIVQKSSLKEVKNMSEWVYLEYDLDCTLVLESLEKQYNNMIEIKEIDSGEYSYQLKVKKSIRDSVVSFISTQYNILSYKAYDCELEEILDEKYADWRS